MRRELRAVTPRGNSGQLDAETRAGVATEAIAKRAWRAAAWSVVGRALARLCIEAQSGPPRIVVGALKRTLRICSR
jgi:hypothetical protein